MDLNLHPLLTPLAKGRTLALTDERGARITCYRGVVWITQERDSRDIILRAGDSFQLDRDGRTLVYALLRSTIAVMHAAELTPLETERTRAGTRSFNEAQFDALVRRAHALRERYFRQFAHTIWNGLLNFGQRLFGRIRKGGKLSRLRDATDKRPRTDAESQLADARYRAGVAHNGIFL